MLKLILVQILNEDYYHFKIIYENLVIINFEEFFKSRLKENDDARLI